MADNLKKTGKADDVRINIKQAHEVAYWSKKLGVTPTELRKARTEADSPMVVDIKKVLKKK